MLIDYFSKVKKWIGDNKNDLILAISFFLVAIIAFGLGRLSAMVERQRKEPISITEGIKGENGDKWVKGKKTEEEEKGRKKDIIMGALLYVGSKNSDKYHLPDCPGASRIKEENKIWFSSEEEAESLGYTPASNCDGL